MTIPTTFATANPRNSRARLPVRRRANVQYLLPSQATTVATATETTLAVSGLCPSTSPGPNRSRLKSPASTTNARPPTDPKRTSSQKRSRIRSA